MDMKDIVYKLKPVCLKKMLQLEDNAAKKGTQFKALILGLGKRVRVYKQESAAAKSLDSKKDHVPLMEWLDLQKLQKHVYIGCIWEKEQEAEERHLSWQSRLNNTITLKIT